MNPLLRSLLSSGLLALSLAGQDQATTLLAACQRADVVVCATVLAASDPSPDWHQLAFRTDAVWKGQLGAQFAVMEPSGACCGRSLFTLRVADRCVLFLQRQGPRLHPFGGGRGVVALDPALAAHVQALLGAADDAARARLLAAGLASSHPRIAHDAAHALAVLPVLAVDAAGETAIRDALASAVQTGRTTAAPLLEAAVRLGDATTLDLLLPLYFAADRSDQARLLRTGLLRCAPERIVDRLPLHVGTDERVQLRAAELLAALDAETAVAALRGLLGRTDNPRVQLCAVEGLLAAGVLPAALRSAAPAPVLQLAERRRDQARSFRSIDATRR